MPTSGTAFIPQAPSGPGNATGIRNYDYTFKYPRDKRGEEHKENARVWNVYLDEAEMYDTEMIQGFRNIIDGVLVFAALFSAIVTTFITQTSQALQPDNAQITVSLLLENNLLLRAAGNITTMNTVPRGLSPEAVTHTTIDTWVNGLFFSSLALSLSSALLTVLAKQWIQAYTAVVSGPARTRSLIRHIRFEGIQEWKFETVIQCLPLILHGSVVMFLVGLTLYVSKISSPICGVVSVILVVTMGFYLGTSILSVVYFKSPFRVPILMNMVQWVFDMALLLHMCSMRLLKWVGPPVKPLPHSIQSLRVNRKWKDMEHDAVVQPMHPWTLPLAILNSLKWLADRSVDHSVTNVVAEAASSLLMEKDIEANFALPPSFASDIIPRAKFRSFHCFRYSDLLLRLIGSLEGRFRATNSEYDSNNISTWADLVRIMFEAASDGYQIGMDTYSRFAVADHMNDTVLCERILDWSKNLSREDGEFDNLSWNIVNSGGAAGARAFLRKFPHLLLERLPRRRTTLFHHAACHANMMVVAAIVQDYPSIISAQDSDDKTALEHAARFHQFPVVDFLLEQGAERPPHLLHNLIRELEFSTAHHLLERGWDPFLEDGSGRTAFELANEMYHFKQGTLFNPDVPVNVRNRRSHELRDLFDKMKHMPTQH
ncbi:hypothetical protein DXG01_009266 [Tephrocybe rancida]|nr:hypothetical protein DXG01_009266 [Tephrocybe rancida]